MAGWMDVHTYVCSFNIRLLFLVAIVGVVLTIASDDEEQALATMAMAMTMMAKFETLFCVVCITNGQKIQKTQ